MRFCKSSIFLFICILFNTSFATRILGVFPWPSKSHLITFSALTHALAERGHELVVVSAFPSENPPANYKDVNIWDSVRSWNEKMLNNSDIYNFHDTSRMALAINYQTFGCEVMTMLLDSKEMKDLLKDERGFDLVISEDFLGDVLFGFSHYFKAPLIVVSSSGGLHWTNYAVGNYFNPAYVPLAVLDHADRKSFSERFTSTLFTLYWDVCAEIYYYPKQNQLKEEFYGPGLPSLQELRRTASLVMVNNHFTLNYPRPLVPAFVEVGGMHLKPPKNTLSSEMKKWLDDAQEGTIYFSMGSNLRGDKMPVEMRNAFLEAFAKLNQRVVWKWESESLPGQPENVLISKWAPQTEILAHPNVKLFITHGGLLSCQEAVYNGIPIVGVPIVGDQKMNVLKAVKEGYGVMLSIKNITTDSVFSAINIGLNDESVRKEAERRQTIFLDQPETPLERAVFWTEYILRHKGASHLRSAALDLAWYQVECFDVYLFLIATSFVLILVPYWIGKLIFSTNKNIKLKLRGVKEKIK